MNKPKLLIFASGSATGGGSGFGKMCLTNIEGILDAEIVSVVSNHEFGGVRALAEKYNIPFILFKGPYTAENYQKIVLDTGAEWVALSGWLKLVSGLDPRTTFNIHPAPLPRFGGKGMYGHYAHEEVWKAYQAGEITHSAVSMHFVTPKYDDGPVFFTKKVLLVSEDTAETIGAKVNAQEHLWQSKITNMIIHKQISWDGIDPNSLTGEIHL